MQEENTQSTGSAEKCKPHKCGPCGGAGGAVYGMGLIGAAIYFIQQASGFWPIILGILKAIVWPAFLVYKLFQFLGI